jgi:stage III sporulation protein AH
VAGTAQQDETGETVQTAARAKQYFSDAKLQQAQYRDSIRDEIASLMENDALDEAGKEKLMKLLTALDSRQKRQTDCETLLKAKLGGDCVVVLGDETAQVVVEPGTVNETSSLQIAEILAKHAQITSDNLTIIEAKEETTQKEDVKK